MLKKNQLPEEVCKICYPLCNIWNVSIGSVIIRLLRDGVAILSIRWIQVEFVVLPGQICHLLQTRRQNTMATSLTKPPTSSRKATYNTEKARPRFNWHMSTLYGLLLPVFVLVVVKQICSVMRRLFAISFTLLLLLLLLFPFFSFLGHLTQTVSQRTAA